MEKSRCLGWILVACYTTLCLIPVGLVAWGHLFRPGKFELAGVWLVVLGAPWTLVVAVAAAWTHVSSAWLLGSAIVAGCTINARLWYLLGKKLATAG
jgi:hypothetical protein